jgi:asparagine synthase (glutamine-hydrolysing)
VCGLLFSSVTTVTLDSFRKSLTSMRHRGPDYQAISTFGNNVFMGHSRLSVLDLDERSHQPFSNQQNTVHLIFNGEIFNFRELKELFCIQTRTTSDTEILLELYLLLGEKALDHLNGMFAFIIYHSDSGAVFAARDRLGIKPLYYAERDDGIIFSSELNAILHLLPDRSPDLLGIRQYLKARAFFNGRTLFSHIKMFPAGGYYQHGRYKSYWDLPVRPEQGRIDEQQLLFLIKDAVRLCCVSDVPIGVLLSGGLDSAIIAGLAGQADTWTVGFDCDNEFDWSRIAAQKFGTRHHEILIDPDEFLETAAQLILARQEPLSVPNEVLIYKMSLSIHPKNRVILSGEGSDELFFGYDRIFSWAMNHRWDIYEFDKYYSYGAHKDFEILEDILTPVSQCNENSVKVGLFFQRYHLHGLLRRLDNSTMMCSVEARVPFVDHRLVECLHMVTPFDKICNGVAKAPLKKIFRNLVPSEIICRPKIGFPVPLAQIFQTKNQSNVSQGGMDKWLDFNMKKLYGDSWPDIRASIMNDIYRSGYCQ